MKSASLALACLLVALCWQGDVSGSHITAKLHQSHQLAWAWCWPSCTSISGRKGVSIATRPLINVLVLRNNEEVTHRGRRGRTLCMCEATGRAPPGDGAGKASVTKGAASAKKASLSDDPRKNVAESSDIRISKSTSWDTSDELELPGKRV
jgi:hypothetical protein